MTAADVPDPDRDGDEDDRRDGRARRERVLEALRGAHDGVRSALEAAADDAADDSAVADALDAWAAPTGDRERDRSERVARAATRRATVLVERLLRYESRRRDASGGDDVPGGCTAASDQLSRLINDAGELDPVELVDRLREAPATVTAFGDDTADLFAPLRDDEQLRRRLAGLVRTVERESIDGVEGALPGELYEALVPAAERKARGQFYTHPAIAEALVRWALDTDDDRIPRVLDPAAGCGTFSVAAYRRLAERFPDADREALLDGVVAIDVERFPVETTARGLAALGGDADRVRAYRGSFFDLEPGADPVSVDGIDSLGAGGPVGPVDAVVGNPPYVEAGTLAPDRAHFRAHLRELGPDGAAPYADGAKAIGATADAYVYFATQATRFLRPGGRLAFVVPTKWMMSRYGEQFQAFLRDHYRIEAVVGFDARAFSDALVDTSLLLLERCHDERRRRENTVTFLQLHDEVGPETLLEAIEIDDPPTEEPTIDRGSAFRTVGVPQRALADRAERGKIAHYLVAPEELLALVESDDLSPLGELADVKRGAMTGSTAFFFPDGDDVAAHGIEATFLRPALKSMRGHETVVLDDADVDRWFVDVHEYVEAVRDRTADGGEDDPLEARVKRALEADGYGGFLSWIRRAEAEGEHLGATCEGREVWFDFGDPPRPEILFQKLLRERLFSIYNRAGAVPSNAVDCIDVHDDVDSTALFGVLNSSLALAIMEVWGRNEAGMLQLMTYETRSLPVPDVRAMSATERGRIAAVVDGVLEHGASALSEEDRDRLDAAVLAAVDSIDLSVERAQAIQRYMLERRVGAGEATEVLVAESDP